ncbi:prepilin peptidase [Enterococcus mundtii]|uniref:prepilin peptidase n=1 Tax=Enterococcus mundtii TaxID=53346 RepID=UPI002DB91A7E|nr:prepilin peptidase [Enterococcus mundtii]MEC3942403.1 prepilin peptidase [Enterococcus mundtii]
MFLHFIIGCCFGSFLCLVAQRVPKDLSIISPRSHCVNCHQTLRWYELIPLLSILMQRFRCRTCQTKLSPMYPLAELISGTLFMYAECYLPDTVHLIWLSIAFLFSLMDIFHLAIDIRILYFSWTFLWVYWLLTDQFQVSTSLLFSLISFGLLRYGQAYLGAGDTLLLLSWSGGITSSQLIMLLFLASCLGISYFGLTALLHKKRKQLPFIPFLSIALWLTLHFR